MLADDEEGMGGWKWNYYRRFLIVMGIFTAILLLLELWLLD